MRIGVDVSGGDNAPHEILKGCFDVLERLDPDDVLVLAGNEDEIREAIAERGVDDPRLSILGCGDPIAMDESPVEAVRAK
jgi:phosphate acyltransferase